MELLCQTGHDNRHITLDRQLFRAKFLTYLVPERVDLVFALSGVVDNRYGLVFSVSVPELFEWGTAG